jgi:hypothetical protein
MSDHGDHDDHGHGHGAAAEPEAPTEPRPALQGVGIALCVLGTVLLAIFVQG